MEIGKTYDKGTTDNFHPLKTELTKENGAFTQEGPLVGLLLFDDFTWNHFDGPFNFFLVFTILPKNTPVTTGSFSHFSGCENASNNGFLYHSCSQARE